MKILVAPDSFKGSLTAKQFCHIVSDQIQKSKLNSLIYSLPLADGGEGTIDAILANTSGKRISTKVRNPLGNEINAEYAVLSESKTAIIEMAQASGLPLLVTDELNPMLTSSYGTGELIRAVLDKGYRKIIIGLGGSATNDAGSGMLQALGVRFINAQGDDLAICGGNLLDIESINLSALDSRIKNCEIIIAGDVTNPLLGKQGASYIFAPQKGASAEQVISLEAGLKHFAFKSGESLGLNKVQLSHYIEASGSGAAGGMGFSLILYCQAIMQSGFELIADFANLDALLEPPETRPDLIITGEGRFDHQSLQGKLISRLVQRAEKHQIPVVAICGSIDKNVDLSSMASNMSISALCEGGMSLDDSINNVETLLRKKINQILRA